MVRSDVSGDGRKVGQRELPSSVLAPSLARAFVADVLHTLELDSLVEMAQLLASEAVTNAVVHAHTPSVLEIMLKADSLRITVADQGHDGIPSRRSPSPYAADGGRGLFIIDTVAPRWGLEQSAAGTEVWFEMDLVTAVP
jgi:anti-sigma regulatory factor (Ser/Thr protein kinase)